MIPVVTPQEMRLIDQAATEPPDDLIERAGAAVARTAIRMLGGTYGRRVTVVAGTGNNGNDGRVAARRLARRGVRITLLPPDADVVPPDDLVIDAAFGTGYRAGDRSWDAPAMPTGASPARVLAVDIPSGVDGLTGGAAGRVLAAERTVTFAALKPGLLFPPGRELAGVLEVVDIGLPAPSATHLVERRDVQAWLPRRAVDAHKWRAAVWVVAGSPEMLGAAHLAARAAQRAGAGMVRLSSPGVEHDPAAPTEAVLHRLGHGASGGWAEDIVAGAERFGALVVGPGLGRTDVVIDQVRLLVGKVPTPLVVDGDGLFALAGHEALVGDRDAGTVLTPHDGEYERLAGVPPGPDRIAAARQLSVRTGAVVLLKGATTVVADPGGRALIVTSGDERLATAGTGDVLSGILGSLLAQGMEPFAAAAAAAWVHGEAGKLGPRRGLVAGDLVDHLPEVMA